MNNTKTGNNIAAAIEPTETILVIIININAKIKHINPIFQLTKSNTPSDVATPFPPLNPKNTGKVCPTIDAIAANCTNTSLFSYLNIFPINTAKRIATIPFKISQTRVSNATFFPAVLKAFVLPAFPLPFSLKSKPAIFFSTLYSFFQD